METHPRPGTSARASYTRNGGLDLWYDIQGSSGSAVVLLAGAALQASLWEAEVTARFVAAGHSVIRLDWRDVGLSGRGDFRTDPYTLVDLADDVIAVVDAAGYDAVHVVGFSMGGLVAQFVAAMHPRRVRTLTLLAAGYGGGAILGGTTRADAVVRQLIGGAASADGDVVEKQVAYWRLLWGKTLPFDETGWRHRVEAWVERGHNPRCPHLRIPQYERSLDTWIADPVARADRIGSIDAAPLVVHGDDDGMFPLANAHAIVATIPRARLHILDGRGHDLFLDPTGEIAELVLDHIDDDRPV